MSFVTSRVGRQDEDVPDSGTARFYDALNKKTQEAPAPVRGASAPIRGAERTLTLDYDTAAPPNMEGIAPDELGVAPVPAPDAPTYRRLPKTPPLLSRDDPYVFRPEWVSKTLGGLADEPSTDASAPDDMPAPPIPAPEGVSPSPMTAMAKGKDTSAVPSPPDERAPKPVEWTKNDDYVERFGGKPTPEARTGLAAAPIPPFPAPILPYLMKKRQETQDGDMPAPPTPPPDAPKPPTPPDAGMGAVADVGEQAVQAFSGKAPAASAGDAPPADAPMPDEPLPAPPMPPEDPRPSPLARATPAAPPSRDDLLRTAADEIQGRRGSGITRTGEAINAAFMRRKQNQSAGEYIDKADDREAAQAKGAADRQSQLAKAAQEIAFRREGVAGANTRAANTLAETKRHNLAEEGKPAAFAPLPTTTDPLKQRKLELDVKKAEYDDAHRGDPKPPSARDAATDARWEAGQEAKRTEALTKISNMHDGYAGVLRDLDKLAPGAATGDASNLPGWGEMTASQLPVVKNFVSQHAQDVQQLQNRLQALVALDTSGKVLSPAEIANLKSFMGADWIARPEMFASAMDNLRKGLFRSTKATEAAYGKHGNAADRIAVTEPFLKTNPQAITSSDPLFKDLNGPAATPAPATKAAPPVPEGHTRMRGPDGVEDVPNESVEAALADHYVRI